MLMQTVKMGGFAPHRVGYQSLFTPPAWSPSWSPAQREAFQTKPELGQAVAPSVPAAPGTPSDLTASKRALLAAAAKKVIDTGNAVTNALNAVYRQYANRANPGFWSSLASRYLSLYGLDLNKWMTGTSDAQAVLKLRAASKLGYEWVNQVKDQWYGDNPSVEINLAEEAIATDESINDQVGMAFDNVIDALSRVVTITGRIETLPENLIRQGVKTFWGSLGDSVAGIGKDLSNVGQGILDLLHAAGQAAKGTGAAAREVTGSSWAPVIGVGLVVVALIVLLR